MFKQLLIIIFIMFLPFQIFSKFGEYISERDYNRALKDLNKEEFRVSTGVEKRKIREKIRFLKGVLKK